MSKFFGKQGAFAQFRAEKQAFFDGFSPMGLSRTRPTPQTKNAPPRERAAFKVLTSAEEVDESQHVEHYACEGEKVPDHVGELESS